LARAPGLIATYAAGVSAGAARRYGLLAFLLRGLYAEDTQGRRGRLVESVGHSEVLSLQDSGKRLHDYLQPIIGGYLSRRLSYDDDWDRWELLVAVGLFHAAREGGFSGTWRLPYVRVDGALQQYHAVVGNSLREELLSSGSAIVAAGYCGGVIDSFDSALADLEKELNGASSRSFFSGQAPLRGRAGPFYAY
jgi:hypothetical protein